ncbi:hypothetical protein ACHAPT_009301 [Fusarium lateritium]
MYNLWMSVFFVIVLLVDFASGDDLDDFTNSIFSDFAPFLALFGEKVTMQLLSQALDWGDCVTLAMAPLGVLTIIVSAIRVAGPTSFKAYVGRAKENKAVAELELMSSTSTEVCELYNGSHIVRCLGSAQVRELVCLVRRDHPPGKEHTKIEFKKLEEAKKEGLLFEEKDGSHPTQRSTETSLEKGQMSQGRDNAEATLKDSRGVPDSSKKQDSDGSATLIVIHDDRPEAPNISLNLRDARKKRVRALAVIGSLVQATVIAFQGMMAHYGKISPSFKKDDEPVDRSAFSMATIGLLLMMAGVFICAHVVEISTEETVYRADKRFAMNLHWLQKDQRVNDQVFESFATAPSKPCSTLSWSIRDKSEHTNRLTRGKTALGVSLAVLGFIVQVSGMRGMNSAASLVQLLAVIIMTFFRVSARPGYARFFEKNKLLGGFELEWLSWRLLNDRSYSDREEDVKREDEKKYRCLGDWCVVTHPEVKYRAFVAHTLIKEDPKTVSEAQRLLLMRRGLGKLINDHSASSVRAEKVANAMTRALNILFPDGPSGQKTTESNSGTAVDSGEQAAAANPCRHTATKSDPSTPADSGSHTATNSGRQTASGFRWTFDVYQGFVTCPSQEVWIDLAFGEGGWRVSRDDVVAVVGLWSYTTRASDAANEEEKDTRHVDGVRWPIDLVQPCLKALGSGHDGLKSQVIQDFAAWAGQGLESLMAIKEAWYGGEKEVDEEEESLPHISGCQGNHPRSAGHSARRRPRRIAGGGSRMMEKDCSLVDLYATDFLFSFMWSAAITLPDRLRWKAEVRPNAPNGQHDLSPLLCTDMTALVSTFRAASAWADYETCLGVIAPLSVMGKLPTPMPWFESLKTKAEETRSPFWKFRHENYKQMLSQADYLLRTYKHGTSGIGERVVAWMLKEYCVYRPQSNYGMEQIDHNYMRSLRSHIEKYAKESHGGLLEHITELYKRRGRQMPEAFHRTFQQQQELPVCLDVTPLHKWAMDLNVDKSSCPCGTWRDEYRDLINVQDVCGFTPLEYAKSNAKSNDDQLVHFLESLERQQRFREAGSSVGYLATA